MAAVKVTNRTEYPTREVAALVRRTLRELECEHVAVTVKHPKRGRGETYAAGRYRPYWFPSQGECMEQIAVRLPRPGLAIKDYRPYQRTREEGRAFPLETWQEALVAIVAHEGMHHKQTPRNGFGAGRRRGRFVEVECDLAAYRAWKRLRGEL